MTDQVRTVSYFAVTVDDKPGEGARITKEIKKRGINLLAVHGFPTQGGKTQVDLVPEDSKAFTRAAQELGWSVGAGKAAFLIQGEDRAGAMAEIYERLAKSGINLIAATGIAAGKGRYGCLLWVAPADVEAATRALGAGVLTA